MKLTGLGIVLIGAAVGVGAFWWTENRALNDAERALFSRIDAATRENPPLAAEIISAFGLPVTCEDKSCSIKGGSMDPIRYSELSLRQPKEGLILVADGLGNVCVRAQRVRSYYSASPPEQSCYDASCWYLRSQKDWGIITFEVQRPDSRCVSSAVINSTPEWRRSRY